jgi:hypothetical protein
MGDHRYVQAVQSNVTIVALIDMEDQGHVANALRWL